LRPNSSKLITYAHGEEILVVLTSKTFRTISRLVYSRSDLIIANSENTKELVSEMCPSANVVCIHPGVDAFSYVIENEKAGRYRMELGWPPETVIVSTLARMEARKNHAMVLHAVGELRREGQPIAYICGSDGQEKARLLELSSKMELESWVKFTGTVSEQEKRLIYSVSDIYAMPSIQVGEMIEGFGIVFLEAAAAGIPSVAGNSGGQAEAVVDGMTGYVIDGNDLSKVKDAIRELVKDKSLRQRMGRAGKAWAKEHDWVRITENITRAVNCC
jgi:phosphatidylinositol alpha-1,6-mannosyltransferase